MDGKVRIESFNEESKIISALSSEEDSQNLLKQAKQKLGKDRYNELLSTPIVGYSWVVKL